MNILLVQSMVKIWHEIQWGPINQDGGSTFIVGSMDGNMQVFINWDIDSFYLGVCYVTVTYYVTTSISFLINSMPHKQIYYIRFIVYQSFCLMDVENV